MHLKSCPKLLRSELRLDLGQQQGALQSRGCGTRPPLAVLSTNTLRSGPRGGAVLGGVARARGTENSGFMGDEGTGLDVWSVIRPGHVREKIALFAHDRDRTTKGGRDVTAKRRRRNPQPMAILPRGPASDVLSLAAVDAVDDDLKLSVVEMVAFLEKRVTCSSRPKLRSSASITLSRGPPAPSPLPAPSAALGSSDGPVPADEMECLSVSDMVAKLESQCLRRHCQNERRSVGRVLLAEQHPPSLPINDLQPIVGSEMPEAPPSHCSMSADTRRTTLSVCISMKIKACFSAEVTLPQTVATTQATPPSPEHNNAIGRRTEQTLSLQTQVSKSFFLSETPRAETPAALKRSRKELAPTLTRSAHCDVISQTIMSPALFSAKCLRGEESFCEKASTPDISKQLLITQNSPQSVTSLAALPREEPLPGLLFLTPPSRPCIQSDCDSLQMRSMCDLTVQPDRDGTNASVFEFDVIVQSQTSPSPSPAPSSASGQSEKTKQEPHELAVRLEESKPQSVRTYPWDAEAPHQSQKSVASSNQLEMRPRRASPIQSETRMCGSVLLRSSSDVGSERRRRRKSSRSLSLCSAEGVGRYTEGAGQVASEDFLLMRRRVQILLEPRAQVSFLSLLPHHLLLQVLLLLPTRALAALKCSCRYLRLVIDTYDPRPLDALWVCDPRYRDDPCKQCKRRHRHGDVSLCRWHHKPFCQAMPYGPGYWMCCRGDRRDAPGCNVGLHDNRWVPSFHSINSPIYRQRPRDEQSGS